MYACVGGWCDLRSVTQATCSHVGGWCELRTVTQATCTRVRGWWVLRNVTQTTCTHMGGWCVLRTGIATFSALSSTYSLGASHLWITGNSSSGWGVKFITCPLVILFFWNKIILFILWKFHTFSQCIFYHNLPQYYSTSNPLCISPSPNTAFSQLLGFFSPFFPKGILIVTEFPDMV